MGSLSQEESVWLWDKQDNDTQWPGQLHEEDELEAESCCILMVQGAVLLSCFCGIG